MKKKTPTNWQIIAAMARANAADYLHESKVFALNNSPEAATGSFANFQESKRAVRYAERRM